jgi:hypothetical protein
VDKEWEEWLKKVELSERKTARIRELLDKTSEESINRYAVKTGNPIYHSHQGAIDIIKKEFGEGIRKEYIPFIINDPDYVLAPKGLPPIPRSKNIEFLVGEGYDPVKLKNLSDADIRDEANEQRNNIKRRGVPRKKRSTPQLKPSGIWPQATIKERHSRKGFAARGWPTPPMSAPFRAEMIGTAMAPVIFPWLNQLDHIETGESGGSHVPWNYQALSERDHADKSAYEARMRGSKSHLAMPKRIPNINEFNEYNLHPNLRGLLAENIKTTGFMSLLKPALKVGARALGVAALPLTAKASMDYKQSGHPYLATVAGLSAIPGLSLPMLAAEGVGNIWNRDVERMRNKDNIFTSPYQRRRMKRIMGLLDN